MIVKFIRMRFPLFYLSSTKSYKLFEFHSLTGPLFLIENLIVSIGMLREDYEDFIPRK